jgi:hypothetical protein
MSLNIEALLNLIDSIVIIIPAIVTIILAWKVKNGIMSLRILTSLLALFLIVHGSYHFLAFYNIAYNSAMAGFLGEAIIQPFSWGVLVAFGAYYMKTAG